MVLAPLTAPRGTRATAVRWRQASPKRHRKKLAGAGRIVHYTSGELLLFVGIGTVIMNRASGFLVRQLRQQMQAELLANQPDRLLLEQFVATCDEAAFTALVTRHGPMVLGVCRRLLRDWHAMEDVFQATFIVLARRATSIRKSESVASWLHSVAYRLSLRARAHAARRQEYERMAPGRAVAEPADEASVREVEAIVDEELNRLPEGFRAVLVSCCLDGNTCDEAARQLGLPLRTLQRRLERGRKLLLARLGRRGLVFGTALFASILSQQAGTAAPPMLVDAAASAALCGASSGTAAALATGLLQSMRVAAWKTAAALLLTLGWAIAGIGWAAWGIGGENWFAPHVAGNPQAAAAKPDEVQADDRLHGQQHSGPIGARPQQAARLQHAGPVTCVAIAPDGKTLASGGEGTDTTVRLWDMATGRQIYQVDVHSGVLAVALSREGVLAAGCADRTIRLFETKTGKALRTLDGHQATVAGKESYFPPGTHNGVSSLLFTDAGKTLISGGYDGTVRLWDVAGGKQVEQLTLAGHRIHRLALSQDGKTLAAGCEEPGAVGHHRVHLWDMASRQPIRPDLPGFKGIYSNGPVLALAFAPDGKRLAVGGFDNEVAVWDVSTGKTVGAYRAGFLIIQSLAFSPKGERLAAGCMDGNIHFWNTSTAELFTQVATPAGQGGARMNGVSSVVFAPDGRTLISGASDQRVRLWDVASGKERALPE